MARLQVSLLGGFQARLGSGVPLVLPTRKGQALLAYLALTPGQAHPRDKLAALLWGGIREESARASLRQALFAIRKALGEDVQSVLRQEGEALALDVEGVDVDVTSFEQAVKDSTPTALARAADVYRGDLLAGLVIDEAPFEEWLLGERERLRELALEAYAKLLRGQRDAGATDAAVQTALKLLALDPSQEAVHRALMRLYTDLGRRGAALRQYQQCVSVLQRELGVEPEGETKALYQEVLRQRPPREPTTSLSLRETTTVPPATHEAPLVGRGPELAQLVEALQAARGGRGRMVVVLGEAGIGKSRLTAELAAEATRQGSRVLLGRSYESEQILAFGPWVDAFRRGRALTEDLGALGAAWLPELARLFPEVANPSTQLPQDTDHLRLFEALAQLVTHLAARQPIVLIVEDLHWADDMSLRFFSFLGRRLEGRPVVLLGTAREEDLAGTPALRAVLQELDRDQCLVRMSLASLTRSDTVVLVRELARTGIDDSTLAPLVEQIWRISEGNPFIVVETMRALRERPSLDRSAAVPHRVRELIAGRLERLNPRTCEMALLAAVIGRDFDFALLQKASGLDEGETAGSIEELVRQRILHVVGERFEFAHDRIREVAYGVLLPPRRKLLHGAVARALEAMYAGALEPPYAALGFHYREGEIWDKAVSYLGRAGAQAAARSAPADARALYEQALGVVEALPESRATLQQAFEIRLTLRQVLTVLGEVRSALQRLREAEALAERLNDDRERGRVCAFMATIHSLLGELDDAGAFATRARAIAQAVGDLELGILATTYLEQVHYLRGEYDPVVELAAANLAALPAAWVHKSFGSGITASVYDRCWLVMALAQLGRFVEAAEPAAEAMRLAEPTQHAFTIGQIYYAASLRCLLSGDYPAARALIERWITLARKGNVLLLLPTALASSAWTLAQLGEAGEAMNRCREAEQLLERQTASGIVRLLGWDYHALGRACLALGRLDEARSLGERAIESSLRQAGFAAHGLHLLGDIATHPRRFDAENGETYYRQALALAEPRGMRPLVAHCHLGLGKLYEATCDGPRALKHLTTAATMYRDLGMEFWRAQAEATLQSPGNDP